MLVLSLAVGVGLLLSVGRVSAQAGPLAVVQRAIEASNNNDMEAFFGLLTEDVVVIGVGECTAGVCSGKAALRQELESGLEEIGAPPKLTILGTAQTVGNTVTFRASRASYRTSPFSRRSE